MNRQLIIDELLNMKKYSKSLSIRETSNLKYALGKITSWTILRIGGDIGIKSLFGGRSINKDRHKNSHFIKLNGWQHLLCC